MFKLKVKLINTIDNILIFILPPISFFQNATIKSRRFPAQDGYVMLYFIRYNQPLLIHIQYVKLLTTVPADLVNFYRD